MIVCRYLSLSLSLSLSIYIYIYIYIYSPLIHTKVECRGDLLAITTERPCSFTNSNNPDDLSISRSSDTAPSHTCDTAPGHTCDTAPSHTCDTAPSPVTRLLVTPVTRLLVTPVTRLLVTPVTRLLVTPVESHASAASARERRITALYKSDQQQQPIDKVAYIWSSRSCQLTLNNRSC